MSEPETLDRCSSTTSQRKSLFSMNNSTVMEYNPFQAKSMDYPRFPPPPPAYFPMPNSMPAGYTYPSTPIPMPFFASPNNADTSNLSSQESSPQGMHPQPMMMPFGMPSQMMPPSPFMYPQQPQHQQPVIINNYFIGKDSAEGVFMKKKVVECVDLEGDEGSSKKTKPQEDSPVIKSSEKVCKSCRDLGSVHKFSDTDAMRQHAQVHSAQNGRSLEQTFQLCFGIPFRLPPSSSGKRAEITPTMSRSKNMGTDETSSPNPNRIPKKEPEEPPFAVMDESTMKPAPVVAFSSKKKPDEEVSNQAAKRKRKTRAEMEASRTEPGPKKPAHGIPPPLKKPILNPSLPWDKNKKSSDTHRTGKQAISEKNLGIPESPKVNRGNAHPFHQSKATGSWNGTNESPTKFLREKCPTYWSALKKALKLPTTKCTFSNCNTTFSNQTLTISQLETHALTHFKIHAYQCRKCEKALKSDQISNHCDTNHNGVQDVQDHRGKYQKELVLSIQKCFLDKNQ